MRFSIILPAHNAAPFIRKALDSIKAQTFTDYELIVVCDACTDNTAAIAREYTDKVLEVNFANPGPTRSAGLDIAQGEYILFTDDDDWWLHEYAFEMIDAEITDSTDLLCFGFIWKGRGYTSPYRENGYMWPAVWNKAWRRTAIGDIRFPSEYPDDLLFHNRMVTERMMRIRFFDHALYYYDYLRPGSNSVRLIAAGIEPDLRKK